ncbi:MAG: hypothetical protein GF403_08880 [Candidatus Coatesbacteria bacterium]|nr:hypothetical protein [Candidatus Coatesbacteria bacterium]
MKPPKPALIIALVFSTAPVLAAPTVAELAAASDSPDFAERVASLDDSVLLNGLTEIAGDDSLGEARRLELLEPFARTSGGGRALARLDSDLALLALAAGLPDNLPLLLEIYSGEEEIVGERITAALYFGRERIEALLEGIAEGGSDNAPAAAAVLYDTFGAIFVEPLIAALDLEGRPPVVAAVALREAEESAFQPLLDAVRVGRDGAIAFAPLIFSAGGQPAVTFLDAYLESPDLDVRRLAVTVLSRFTGKDYGYMMDYEADADDYRREGLPLPSELEED